MKEEIKKVLRDYSDREARISLEFFLCFNLIGENINTKVDIKKAVYNTLDTLGIES
jgi:hypothetical protein